MSENLTRSSLLLLSCARHDDAAAAAGALQIHIAKVPGRRHRRLRLLWPGVRYYSLSV